LRGINSISILERDFPESNLPSDWFNLLNKDLIESFTLESFNLDVDEANFNCAMYRFNNRKFGAQYLIRGIFLGDS